ncbi:MAG TPA: family 10 glycosylhydrolase [Candidatus Limisoma gallistercoris]|nr:family 10 glycosylhydrolase [Candidatus Limisoma gallistercoris]
MIVRNIVGIMAFLLALCGCKDASSENPPQPGIEGVSMPRKEVRGVWVATVDRMDWPRNTASAEVQKQEFVEYLDLFEQYNVNMVVMQVRPMADAFYDSPLEPWSQYITGTQGKDPGYDVLQFMIEETHKRGMEFHAWMNPYRISNNVNTFRPAAGHIYNKHPEWTMTYGNLLIFRPALPEVRQFLVDVIDDLITKYDVDGIHFDDYFYPYPASGVELDDQQDFMEYGKEFDNIEDFRRDNVNKAIEAVHNLIVEKRPDVVFSISPYGVWRNRADDPDGSDSSSSITNYDDLYADIRLWCEKGWIDMVVPQLYASTENIAMNFVKMTDWWANNSYNCPVVIGHGVYKFGNPAEGEIFMDPMQLETQFFYARREANVDGSFIFNASVFKDNKINILDNLGKVYADKALIPFMGRETAPEPKPVENLAASGKTLSWESHGERMRYVVYRIDGKEVKIEDVVDTNTYVCGRSGDYAVSAINDDNKESDISVVLTVK